MLRSCPPLPALVVRAPGQPPSGSSVAGLSRPLAGRGSMPRAARERERERAPLAARLAVPMWGVLLALGLTGCGPAPDEPLRRWQVDTADLARGRTLMTHYQCGSCHAVPGVPGGAERAPELARFGRRSYIAGQLPNTPESLQRWLLDPPGMVPGTTMPRLGLSERDARDIAGYLLSLQ